MFFTLFSLKKRCFFEHLEYSKGNVHQNTKRNEVEPMGYTLGQAAEATGKAKSTILKSIRSGRISATKDDLGNWNIEPSELHRLYDPLPSEQSEKQDRTSTIHQENTEKTAYTRELEAKVALLERLCKQVEGERDNLREQNTRLTALLPAALPPERPKSWFRRLLGE